MGLEQNCVSSTQMTECIQENTEDLCTRLTYERDFSMTDNHQKKQMTAETVDPRQVTITKTNMFDCLKHSRKVNRKSEMQVVISDLKS